MGIHYKGSQGQTKRTVELQEEEGRFQITDNILTRNFITMKLFNLSQKYLHFVLHITLFTRKKKT
jgi:hypothetical protein